ncbi:MAG: Smr/MutS family protein [Candidatus Falkowbacteria bacterium]|nr:Smr/MutS family protein [Candidatus Falkowbacteria bacterium]
MVKLAKHSLNRLLAKPEAELDLHGLTKREAEPELDSFLLKAEQMNWQTVKIIVGKGWNSPDGKAVLRAFVVGKLADYGYSYKNAKINEGGEGALIVKFY